MLCEMMKQAGGLLSDWCSESDPSIAILSPPSPMLILMEAVGITSILWTRVWIIADENDL